MKKQFLATAAAIALLAGTNLALAEGMSSDDQKAKGTQPSSQMNKASDTKASDKASDTKAQAQPSSTQKASEPASKPAQSTQAPADTSKSQTTGQASPQQKASEPAKSSTTGQAAPKSTSEPAKSATPAQSSPTTPAQTQTQTPSTSTQTQAPSTSTQTQTAPTGTSQTPSTGASVSLSPEQKSEIRTSVLGSSAPRVSNVNFSISVGTVVPRTVHIIEVPPTLVRIHPAWRGHMYFVVGDQIVIVEKGTLRIVAVITV